MQETFGEDIKKVFSETFTSIKGDAIAFKTVLKIGLIQTYRMIFRDGNSCIL